MYELGGAFKGDAGAHCELVLIARRIMINTCTFSNSDPIRPERRPRHEGVYRGAEAGGAGAGGAGAGTLMLPLPSV